MITSLKIKSITESFRTGEFNPKVRGSLSEPGTTIKRQIDHTLYFNLNEVNAISIVSFPELKEEGLPITQYFFEMWLQDKEQKISYHITEDSIPAVETFIKEWKENHEATTIVNNRWITKS